MAISIITGDLLTQHVDVIVNPWNRNFIPWWLLVPRGVSGAIKKKAGYVPFKELSRIGVLSQGEAVVTSAGRLSFKAIIHVAGIGYNWRSCETLIRKSVNSALQIAKERKFKSIAFPLIGSGTGGCSEAEALRFIEEECSNSNFEGRIVIVCYEAQKQPHGKCYCDLWNKSPNIRNKHLIPDGYCGLCDICGKPGHVRHFPGAVPFTGAWCRKHYYRAMIFHPFGSIGFFVWTIGILGVFGFIMIMW